MTRSPTAPRPTAPVMPRTDRVADALVTLASVDSTNAYARRMIESGAWMLTGTKLMGTGLMGTDETVDTADLGIHGIGVHDVGVGDLGIDDRRSTVNDRDRADRTVIVVAADEQDRGHGRLGRRWVSHPGASFIASFALALPYALATDFAVNGWLQMAAGIAVLDAVRRTVHDAQPIGPESRLMMKWPNDIFCAGRKLGGILCELVALPEATAERESRHIDAMDGTGTGRRIGIVFGIGLNLRIAADDLPIERSTSLQLHWRGLPDINHMRDSIAADIVTRLRTMLREFVEEPVIGIRHLRTRVIEDSYTLGRHVTVSMTNGESVTGTATSVNDDASLTVRDDDGVNHVVRTGDVGVLPL